MRIRGMIHMIELNNKIIGIKSYKHIKFFYFQNGQMSTFKKYLYQDNWIDLEYNPKNIIRKGQYLAYKIDYIFKIEAPGIFDKIVYYDKNLISKSLSLFLDSLDNTMFLDLEMTMPSFNFKGKDYKTEIVQAGLEVCDKEFNVLYKYSNYIMPKYSKTLSDRATDFLKITNEEFKTKAIPYDTFYNEFNQILSNYNPVIITYGKNDQIVLNNSYEINVVPSLSRKTRFVNLCQLIKSYYELKNDPGLFKLYGIYYEFESDQLHDALTDSIVTKKVFEAFKKDIIENKFNNIIRDYFNTK